MTSAEKTFAVITAGGRGTRMNSATNKSFLKLCGKEIILHTLEAFAASPAVDHIIIVIGDDSRKELDDLLSKHHSEKLVAITAGGKERQDSVYQGVLAAKKYGAQADDIVLIHSSVNPLVSKETLAECITAAREHGASAAAAPVKDTIHAANENTHLVEELLHRPRLWAAQTPQCARLSLLLKGFEKAKAEGWSVTDEVQLVKRLGGQVKLINCGYNNIKITTPEDLELAERLIQLNLK